MKRILSAADGWEVALKNFSAGWRKPVRGGVGAHHLGCLVEARSSRYPVLFQTTERLERQDRRTNKIVKDDVRYKMQPERTDFNTLSETFVSRIGGYFRRRS
jgi:hypothetical protein